MKYALGMNPIGPFAGKLPAPSVSGGLLRITFPRMAYATDVTYHVLGSADLQNWTEIWNSTGTAYSGPAGGSQQVTVTDTAGPVAGRKYLRLEVTDP
jgi:hypothetical protein